MNRENVRYVLIGGGLAAVRAAEGIRELDPDGPVLMVGEEPRLPYHRPPLTKGLLLGKKKPEDVYCKPDPFYADKKISVRTGVAAERLDSGARLVTLSDGREVGFEKLLLATGARSRMLDLPGADLPGVYKIRTLSDSLALLAAMQKARRAVVIGGSYIGAEAASALAQNGVQTTMVFPEKRLLERLVDEELGGFLDSLFARHRVAIRAGDKPVRFQGQGKLQAVVTDQGQEFPADLAVVGVGAVLNTALAGQAGLALGQSGGVKVDGHLETGVPGIFAAGDIAEYPDPTYQKLLRLEHWDSAFRQGHLAGRNMAGAGEIFSDLPHYFTTLFDSGFSVWGDFSAWDRTVRKGDLGKKGSWIFYLQKGELRGILAFDPVDKEEEARIEGLVHRRIPEPEVLALAGTAP